MTVRVLPWVGWIVRTAVAEVGWWLGGAWRFLRTAPRRAVGWLAGMLTGWWLDVWTVTAGLVMVAAVPALWFRVWPSSYHRRVGVPLWRHRMIRSTRKGWVELMEAAGLSRHARTRDGSSVVQVPRLGWLRWESGNVLVGQPQLLRAQTVTDVTAVAERLRVDVGSRQIRIVPNSAMTGCEIRWLFTDPLATPILARIPELPTTLPRLDRLELGVTEDEDPFYRDLQVSTLVAGASGSGKAGDMWSVMCQLGPAIGCGLVQVHGIDLKGGAEQAMGPELFTRSATNPTDAVQVLEDAVAGMLARAEGMAGRVRSHTPTVDEPLVLVLIDELAMLTGYLTDRDLSKRADAALRSLLALGRAPAYLVYGYVQDPRKDTVAMRHLFNQATAYRLREREEAAMVFSDGVVAAGVEPHKIPVDSKGVCYAMDEEGMIRRCRTSYVTDQQIRQIAARFPAPVQIAITHEQLEPVEPARPRAARTPRR